MEIKAADVKLHQDDQCWYDGCRMPSSRPKVIRTCSDIIRREGVKLIVAKQHRAAPYRGVCHGRDRRPEAYILCSLQEDQTSCGKCQYAASAEAMLEVAVKT